MPVFFMTFARKIFFEKFRGARASMPPVSYACGKIVQGSTMMATNNDGHTVYPVAVNVS